jgi:hypothetical protein
MDRLQLHYNNQYTFQYTSRPQGGVEIDLLIPYRKADPISHNAADNPKAGLQSRFIMRA